MTRTPEEISRIATLKKLPNLARMLRSLFAVEKKAALEVEFTSKKVARFVAEKLNSKPVGGKRKSKAYEELWNIKYLPR